MATEEFHPHQGIKSDRNILDEVHSNYSCDSSNLSDEEAIQKEAKAMMEGIIEFDEDEEDFDPELTLEEDLDCPVEDVVNEYYQNRIKDIEEEYQRKHSADEREIEELRTMLKESKNAKAEAKKAKKKRVRISSEVEEFGGKERKHNKQPTVCKIIIGKKIAKILICHFYPDQGRLGLQIKQFKSQPHIYVQGVMHGGQASQYENLGPGLLIYEIVSSVDGEPTGIRIKAKSVQELKTIIATQMNKNRKITMKFLVMTPGLHLRDVNQRVMDRKSHRRSSLRHNFGRSFARRVENCVERVERPASRMGRAMSKTFHRYFTL